MFNPFPLHLALPFYGRVSIRSLKNRVIPYSAVSNFLPSGMAYAIGALVSSWFIIPHLSYMDSPPKIRVNPRNPWLKMTNSAVKNNKIRANLRNLRMKTVNFENFFMQNKPNFKKHKISLIPFMTNRYVNICPLGQPENKAKTKPKQSQTKPIQTQF